jgi:hypothetical protein
MRGKIEVSVARDFGTTPGPRLVAHEAHGPYSGERFRKLIIDKLRAADKVVIDMNGTQGYGSSF